MRKVLLLFIALWSFFTIKSDEGMWLLKELNSQNIARMEELGFTFPVNELYDEQNPSLKDAVVIFGGGCSGVIVSNQGLIFTNHHCGYNAIQKLSDVDSNYLKDGFVAKLNSDELPANGLTVSFLRSMEDVTDLIIPNIPSVLNEVQRESIVDSISYELIKKYEEDPFTQASVESFFTRNKYYLVLYDVFRDIRLVITPPTSVGKFGGDTDNLIWPRHTGDFSVFRIYADMDNKPALYNERNVPYQPKYVVPISMSGVRENDYTMTIGYPGSTHRYMSSWGIKQLMEAENTPRSEIRGMRLDILWDAMTSNDTIRLKYADKYASSSNYWKNSIGMNEAIDNLGVLDRRIELESRLNEWIKKDLRRVYKYRDVLPNLNEAYTSSIDLSYYLNYYLETFINGIELYGFANTILHFDVDGTEEDKQAFLDDKLKHSYKNYEPELDKSVLVTLMRSYYTNVPEEFHPDIYMKIDDEFDGDLNKYAEWLYENSNFTSWEKLLPSLENTDIQTLSLDPAMEFALSIKDIGYELMERIMPSFENILTGERKFMSALMEMDSIKIFYPDANFTQRMSYGTIGGYSPSDAIWYDYFTTSNGILEKQVPGDPEFNVQDYILNAIRSGHFGEYADEEGLMRINFISNNDITGGNSGSPVFNGNAELVGLVFDSNWEALSGDILFEPETQRMISVDILYVLYMIDKVMEANHILEELELVD